MDKVTDLLPELCDRYEEIVQVVEPNLLANFGGKERFWGEIVTAQVFEDNSKVRELVFQEGHGRVLVVDGGASMRRALMGDNVAEAAMNNGWAGVIINGCIRDVNAIAELDFGVMALGSHPIKTVKKDIGEINVPVTFGGVTFTPGEYVYADENGILTAPQELTLED